MEDSIIFKSCTIDAGDKNICFMSASPMFSLNMQEIVELRNWLNKIIYLGTNELVET